jgi:hypothetical protein
VGAEDGHQFEREGDDALAASLRLAEHQTATTALGACTRVLGAVGAAEGGAGALVLLAVPPIRLIYPGRVVCPIRGRWIDDRDRTDDEPASRSSS